MVCIIQGSFADRRLPFSTSLVFGILFLAILECSLGFCLLLFGCCCSEPGARRPLYVPQHDARAHSAARQKIFGRTLEADFSWQLRTPRKMQTETLHRETFTQRDSYTETLDAKSAFDTEKLLHAEALTGRSFCTDKLPLKHTFRFSLSLYNTLNY